MSQRTLHFSFGPVQGFVSQARRTRDLWAGSYLLSYLSGRAMRALEEACGDNQGDRTIIFPSVKDDPLMQALRGGANPRSSDLATQAGSLPNRFKAKVPEGVDGSVCVTALVEAWKTVADKVFEKIGTQPDRKKVWDRQITRTWECIWVIGEHERGIDLRKNLRVYLIEPEGGEKCTVCGERQEISGFPGGTRKPINDWWESSIRPRVSELDMRDGERLCAVCLTKRLFPRVAETAIGWAVPRGFPSTSYMAAVPWIIKVLEVDPETAADFYRAAIAGGVGESEKATRIRDIANRLRGADRDQQCFADLDGGVFFEDTLRNERAFPLKESGQREGLLKALAGLCKKVGDHPSPFYALLLMDGDGMGPLLSKYGDKQAEISQALAAFTAKVPGIVRDHNGRLIYAGGDDVFALMPLDQALTCAAHCRQVYITSFKEKASFVHETEAAISAAIEYAHIHTPLGTVVRDAHRLLDEVAKERTGRDAVACRVWKRGGPILTWALPWEEVLKTQDGRSLTLVDEVKRRFQNDQDDPRQFSSKFFYKVRDLFDLLEGDGMASGLSEDEEAGLLAAEYLSSREISWPKEWTDQEKREEAEKRVRRLLALCREQVRHADERGVRFESGRIRADAALLVRFLAQKEV